jgi:protein disulfide-isomerase A6
VGDASWNENCMSTSTCIVAFLPHILDTGAAGRNKYIDILRALSTKLRNKGFRCALALSMAGKPFLKRGMCSYLWAEGGKHPALEKALEVGGSGYPVMRPGPGSLEACLTSSRRPPRS